MSDDIVTRLRDRSLCWCKKHIVAVCSACSERAQAADEIERLRNQIRQLEAERDQWIRQAIGHG